MNTESKGRAWYGKIYRKLETILVEVDTLASQGKVSLKSSDPPGSDSVRDDEPEKLTEDYCSGTFDIEQCSNGTALPRCKSPSDLASDHVEGDSTKEKLSDSVLIDENLEEHSDCNQTATTSLCHKDRISSSQDIDRVSSQASQSTHRSPESLMTATACNDDTFVSPSGVYSGDSNLISLDTEIQAAAVQDKVANMRSFSSNSMKGNQDEFFIEDFDAIPMDTIDLYDMTFREDPSDFDDNLLYAARDRSRQLRSFKKKIMDALTSKRRREKEYEQLAIWFGDADMGCDPSKTKEHATTYAITSLDTKSSQSNVPSATEDSEWELL